MLHKGKVWVGAGSIIWGCMICFLLLTPAWGGGSLENGLAGVIRFYGEVISPVDGERCPMYPSCSHYAGTCIQRHGFLIGWVMAMDRLTRCGGDEKKTAPIFFSNEKKNIYDPVENNDFWWYSK